MARRWMGDQDGVHGRPRLSMLPRRVSVRLLNSAAYRLGHRVVADSYYSPLPHFDALPPEGMRSPLAGIEFDGETQLRYLTDQLGPFLGELDIPRKGGPSDALWLDNDTYAAGDAETLYATIRSRRPGRVLELGSGFTTRIIAMALAANAHGALRVFDPYAGEDLDRLASVNRRSASEIADAEFASLEAGDVLFVDSTHVVKMGSEVNRVILDALPLLAPGVAVHFHDIFLPWDYPQTFFTVWGMFINEQYLLQAFLAMNTGYRILLANHAIGRLYPTEVARLIPSVRDHAAPCGFWIQQPAAG
jgi:hypothetical protein